LIQYTLDGRLDFENAIIDDGNNGYSWEISQVLNNYKAQRKP
jgi:hypothetical protein